MFSVGNLTNEEQQVAFRVDQYFKSPSMSIHEKLFNALLIAQHELEVENFGSENEKIRIMQFKNTIDSLLKKMHP